MLTDWFRTVVESSTKCLEVL